MRTATVKLEGQDRLLCFSAGVVEAACDKYGTLEEFFRALDGDQGTQLRTVIWALAQMMTAGEIYAKRKGLETAPALSEEDIRDCCDIGELLNLRSKVAETITNGAERNVEAEPPKNAVATPGDANPDP